MNALELHQLTRRFGSYTAVDRLLLRPLPYPHPERLAVIAAHMERGGISGDQINVNGAAWELLHREATTVDLAVIARPLLFASVDPEVAAARMLAVTASLTADGAPDPTVTWAARLLRDPAARAEDVAAEVGLSLRQLRRRCQAVVGYGPKTLQRVLRFRGFVSRVDARPPILDLAALAAEAGYADQAHLTRECGRLSGLTPAALARHRAA